ncbi:MAG: hypothetical protein HYT64_01630 [Candidatus Yanofskybacteria bacterium]|nr:hypothetical protein [Candidatus Yanofskybacteria bacterium]
MGAYAAVLWNEWQYHSLQREIAQTTEQLGFVPEHVTGEGGLGRRYPTQEVVRLQLDDLHIRGYHLSDLEYDVLCHKTHWSGCLWFLKQELVARGVVNPTIVRLPAKVRYDSVSWQVSTRSPVHMFVPKIWRGLQSLLRGDISIRDVLRYFFGDR